MDARKLGDLAGGRLTGGLFIKMSSTRAEKRAITDDDDDNQQQMRICRLHSNILVFLVTFPPILQDNLENVKEVVTSGALSIFGEDHVILLLDPR